MAVVISSHLLLLAFSREAPTHLCVFSPHSHPRPPGDGECLPTLHTFYSPEVSD